MGEKEQRYEKDLLEIFDLLYFLWRSNSSFKIDVPFRCDLDLSNLSSSSQSVMLLNTERTFKKFVTIFFLSFSFNSIYRL